MTIHLLDGKVYEQAFGLTPGQQLGGAVVLALIVALVIGSLSVESEQP